MVSAAVKASPAETNLTVLTAFGRTTALLRREIGETATPIYKVKPDDRYFRLRHAQANRPARPAANSARPLGSGTADIPAADDATLVL